MDGAVKIGAADNVGICLRAAAAGESLLGVTLKEPVPAGHKFALALIREKEAVVKYGFPIGRAKRNIAAGEWVHTHNVRSSLDEKTEYAYSCRPENDTEKERLFFRGFRRKKGRAGIRNHIYIVPTVGCVNGVCRELEARARSFVKGSIDGIFALCHQFGCSQLGDDGENIAKLLSAIALNPNASFVLFVGLGCENNAVEKIFERLAPFGRDNVAAFNCQDVEDELTYGMEVLKDFAERAAVLKRENVSFEELCVGLKCGGSDGFSGLTANPLLGLLTDKAVAAGANAVLGEIPEMFGAERVLAEKCVDESVFERFRDTVENFKNFYTKNGFPVYENPSPGNRKGGITTLEEKSLGCVEKAGHTRIMDVIGYGDLVSERGVTVIDTPGNDLIATTAIAAAGCQIVLFTTGRGSPFSTFVPTMKISSNRALAEKKRNWIDFDASSMDENAFFSFVLAALNGEYVCKSEKNPEIAFFKTGVTL